jgi:pimeloyl-CoA synthetase
MLKPLKIHTIHVRTAFEARRALAKVLEEIGKL